MAKIGFLPSKLSTNILMSKSISHNTEHEYCGVVQAKLTTVEKSVLFVDINYFVTQLAR